MNFQTTPNPLCILMLGFFLLFVNLQIGNTQNKIIVDKNGNGDFLTIQEGVDASNEGDTVFVMTGAYPENIIIDHGLHLIGENNRNTSIDGQNQHKCIFVNYNSEAIGTISNFTIRHSGTGFSDNSKNCGILITSTVGPWTISKNKISSHGEVGLISANDGTIVNNVFYNNPTSIFLTQNSNNTVINNVIDSANEGIFIHEQATSATILNNVFFENLKSLVINIQDYVLDYNLFFENVENCDGCSLGNNNLFEDPLFDQTMPLYDYYPLATSPLVNTGIPDLSAFDVQIDDYTSRTRVIAGRIDIGGFENQDVSSINEEELVDIKIVPNPTKAFLRVEGIDHGVFKIHDAIGNLILTQQAKEFDLSQMTGGIYFLTIQTRKNAAQVTKKIVLLE